MTDTQSITRTDQAGGGEQHEGHPIKRRQVRFDWSDTPLHWVPGDPFTTHMVNVLHLLLPPGERWFISVVKEAEPLVTDPELLEKMQPFIQQEAWHAWAHSVVLDRLAEAGIDSGPYTARLEKMFKTVLSDHPSWPAPLRRFWLHRRLAVVAAIEHFTAVLGRWIIENHALDEAGADPVMLDLLRWHGAEEVEHRSLVFDVFENVSGSYAQRVMAMASTAPMLTGWWVAGVRYLMRRDPTLDGASPHWRDWRRAARQGRVPGPWQLLVHAPLRYVRPHHHPVNEASTEMALDYLARSPAARAAEAAG